MNDDYLHQNEFLKSSTQQNRWLIFKIFRQREGLVSEILAQKTSKHLTCSLAFYSILMLFAYGFAMGYYNGPVQALYSGLKLPLLFLGTLVLCFPILYLMMVLMGANTKFKTLFTLSLLALTAGAALLFVLTPISVLLLIRITSREFLSLFHALTLGSACFMMVQYFAGVLSEVSDKTLLYPVHARRILMAWVLLFGFVGSQIAWMLLPFIGDMGREVEFLRQESSQTNVFYELTNNAMTIFDKVRPGANP